MWLKRLNVVLKDIQSSITIHLRPVDGSDLSTYKIRVALIANSLRTKVSFVWFVKKVDLMGKLVLHLRRLKNSTNVALSR
jgi:hypothetical protein